LDVEIVQGLAARRDVPVRFDVPRGYDVGARVVARLYVELAEYDVEARLRAMLIVSGLLSIDEIRNSE
jgi:hypothetical protein